MSNAHPDSFFERLSKEPANRKGRRLLTIDQNLTFHLPARVLVRYDLGAGIEGFWNVEYGTLVLVFVTKPGVEVRVDDIPKEETWSIEGRDLIAEYEGEIFFGELPARFGFVIESPHGILEGYHGHGNEAILIPVQWRQPTGTAALLG